jgi:hypothetical protein
MNDINKYISLELPGVQLNCRSIPAGLVFGLTDEAQYFKLLNSSMACVPFEGTSKMSFFDIQQCVFNTNQNVDDLFDNLDEFQDVEDDED